MHIIGKLNSANVWPTSKEEGILLSKVEKGKIMKMHSVSRAFSGKKSKFLPNLKMGEEEEKEETGGIVGMIAKKVNKALFTKAGH